MSDQGPSGRFQARSVEIPRLGGRGDHRGRIALAGGWGRRVTRGDRDSTLRYATTESDPLLLPPATRLVHIGPPKTGAAIIQGAFQVARAEIERQGVYYAGNCNHPGTALQGFTGRPEFRIAGELPPTSRWRDHVRGIHRARSMRVVASSEFFADAADDFISRIVNDIGREQIHVVVTLRPLAEIVPGEWQQYVKSNMCESFDRWLDAMFNKPIGNLTPTFWQRHRHDRLVERWAKEVGAANVTVVAVDERDDNMVLRVFERLTGLRESTLAAPVNPVDRSLTLPEIEAIRAFNIALREEDLGRPRLAELMRIGAANYMMPRKPEPDEPRVELPEWAMNRCRQISRELVDAISASGVRVVGDIERMAQARPSSPVGDQQAVTIPPEIAARMALGVQLSIPTRQLAGVILRRTPPAAAIRIRRVIDRLQLRRRGIGATGGNTGPGSEASREG